MKKILLVLVVSVFMMGCSLNEGNQDINRELIGLWSSEHGTTMLFCNDLETVIIGNTNKDYIIHGNSLYFTMINNSMNPSIYFNIISLNDNELVVKYRSSKHESLFTRSSY